MTVTSGSITDLFDTPIADLVDKLQDAGRDLWIAGFDAQGRHALIVDLDNDQVTIAPVGTVSGLGRWECTKQHYATHRNVYAERFPHRP